MKRIIILAIVLTMSVASIAAPPANKVTRRHEKKTMSQIFRVATFNNQYNNRSIEAGKWENRKELVCRLLTDEHFDIVGMQEPFGRQMIDMAQALENDYAWVGCNVLDDGHKPRTHYNPIFYRKDRFEVMEWGRFWLSETPDTTGSKSWDSYSPRICVWAKFREKNTGKIFYHFNCHFDHKGQTAREKSAELLLRKIREIADGSPAFCTGDFNSTEENRCYELLVGDGTLIDSHTVAKRRTNDDIPSYNGYRYPAVRQEGKAPDIDHVFVTSGTKVRSWHLIDTAYDGRYPSDHFPIVIEWIVPEKISNATRQCVDNTYSYTYRKREINIVLKENILLDDLRAAVVTHGAESHSVAGINILTLFVSFLICFCNYGRRTRPVYCFFHRKRLFL